MMVLGKPTKKVRTFFRPAPLSFWLLLRRRGSALSGQDEKFFEEAGPMVTLRHEALIFEEHCLKTCCRSHRHLKNKTRRRHDSGPSVQSV